jgi:tetratricopeptide (TPR) repeat protein
VSVTPTAAMIFDHAMMLHQQRKLADAVHAYQQCLLVDPKHAAAWANRGALLLELGNKFDAILNINQSLAIKEDAGLYNNRGTAWIDLGHTDAGMADYRKAISLAPNLVIAHNNLGNAYAQQFGDPETARKCFTESLKIDPSNVEARLYRAMMDLMLGNLVDGFKDYEMRWRSGQLPPRIFNAPHWEGEDLNGKNILLYGEQGLGDMVHFVRYAKVIKDKYPTANLTLEVRMELLRLLRRCEGVDKIIAYGDDPGDQDYTCAMLSAPRILKTTFATIPAEAKYVYADPYRVQSWADDLIQYKKHIGANKLVGLCWSGMPRPMIAAANAIDGRRSTDLNTFAPLGDVKGVTFVSLQQGARSEQVKSPPPGMTILDSTSFFSDFHDTAALIENLDLVIGVDTSVIHVAAALGKPTWVLSRFDGCWRWHGKRSDSPWYPTLRQYRQPRPGDWASVVKQMAADLATFIEPAQLEAAQ